MKLAAILFLLFLSLNAFAQTSDEVLAVANNQKFTSKDLPSGTSETIGIREAFETLPQTIASKRKELLEQQISQILLETEAASQKTTIENLVQKEVKLKVADPNEKQIQEIYDANRANIGDKSLKEIRPQIVAYLRQEPEQKAFNAYLSALRTKYKVVAGKDINAPNLAPTDVLASFGTNKITTTTFETKNKMTLYDLKANVYEQTHNTLEQLLFSTLLVTESKAQNIEPGELIAREVTNKMHDFSDAEREKLQSDLENKLFQKYNAKILLKEPPPMAQTISVEGSPAKGRIGAPVTVVMFSDFQCSHCAETHPILQRIINDYADKIRFVVRNFPLESIHANAYRAAVAAQAANAQGKFFEYIELLYANQDNLDDAALKKYAAQVGLNQKQFDLDLGSEKFAAAVRRDLQDGANYGITGTPTIFVNGVKVRVNSSQGIRNAIELALKTAKK